MKNSTISTIGFRSGTGQLLAVSLFLFSFSVNVQAQTAVIGTVVENNGEILPSATVLLLNAADSVMVRGNVTNDSGDFRLEPVSPGSYILKVSMVGFREHQSQPFDVGQEPVRLDAITLTATVEQLGEVAVRAQRPMFERQIDRLVVNVQTSITLAGNSVLEVLEKSPGVQVNRQAGGIILNGQSGVQVMINDRVVRLPMDAVIQMLDGMNSANVEQVELITTPPARYDADGVAGLINIKMTEHTDFGTSGTVGAEAGYSGAETLGSNFSITRRGARTAWFASYSINYNNNREHWVERRFLRQDGFVEEVFSDNQRRPDITNQNARLGMEWRLGSNTTTGMVLTGSQRKWVTNDLIHSINRTDQVNTLVTELGVRETNRTRNALVNINLEHAFGVEQTLRFDADYIYYKNHNPSLFQNRFLDGDPERMEIEGIDIEKESPLNIWVANVDYRHRISPVLTIETGLKGTLSNFDNDVRVLDRDQGNWVLNPVFTNQADFTEKIGAAYLSADWSPVENLTLMAGLRYEAIDIRLDTPEQRGLVDRKTGHLFPSFFIQQNLSNDSSIRAAYTRRITQPGFNDLAPFVFFINPKSFISGNSNLKPAITDGFNVDYQRKLWLISLNYSNTKDDIAFFQPTIDAGTNVKTYSTENLETLRTWFLSVSFPLTFTSWWELQSFISGRYQHIKTAHLAQNFSENLTGFTLNMTSTVTLPKQFTFEVSGSYDRGFSFGMFERRPYGRVDAGIQKRISEGRGTIRLAANDIFHTDVWQFDMVDRQANMESFWEYDWHFRNIMLTFTWNFGNRSLRNLDLTTGSAEEQDRL
jgi:outer membrane receptor protein involved in Fe transport